MVFGLFDGEKRLVSGGAVSVDLLAGNHHATGDLLTYVPGTGVSRLAEERGTVAIQRRMYLDAAAVA